MDITTLREVAELMERFDLTRVSVSGSGEGDLVMEREPRATVSPVPSPAPAAGAPAADTPAPAQATSPATAPAQAIEGDFVRTSEVCAPMVGVFYIAPAPGAEPFVRVGSRVRKGDTLCILEAMKMMNEVVADRDGEVVEVCVDDGELVEYGRVLFKIY